MVTTTGDPSKHKPRRNFRARLFLSQLAANQRWCIQIAATCMALLIFIVALTGVISFFLDNSHTKYKANLHPERELHEAYECIGWHTTVGLTPFGIPRLWRYFKHTLFRQISVPCHIKIEPDESGYCELKHKQTGQRVHVLHHTYEPFRGPRTHPIFACYMANRILDFSKEFANPPAPDLPIQEGTGGRGILIYVRDKGELPSVYALVQLLRQNYHCTLPMELWIHGGEDELRHRDTILDHPIWKAILAMPKVTYRMHWDYHYQGVSNVPYSIAYTNFEEVLVLGTTNFPLRDPTYLFETRQYQRHGALFWKEFFSPLVPQPTPRKHLMLELLGIPAQSPLRQQAEMDAAQMVLDRRKIAPALPLLLLLARAPWFDAFRVGDKDLYLYRFAWHFSHMPFDFVEEPPALVLDNRKEACAQTMIQPGPSTEEDPLFVHLKGNFQKDFLSHSPGVWDRGAYYKGPSNNQQYAIETMYQDGDQLLPCYYTKRSFSFEERSFANTNVAQLEELVRKYAQEAMALQ